MNVYFLNAPFIPRFSRMSRWEAVDRGGTVYYPYWLAYAAGVVEEAHHHVRLADSQAGNWTLEDTIRDVNDFDPDLAVVDTAFSSMSNDVRVAEAIKAAENDVTTVLVGPPASQFPEMMLRSNGVDFVARFEYDLTVRQIAEAIHNDEDSKHVRGISYKENGKVVHTPNRKLIENLDRIPFVSKVYKRHLNIENYFLAQCLHPVVQIFTGRGCPNLCTFCSWPRTFMGRKYRTRSIANVLEEFKYIGSELPRVKEIFIEDDTFTINSKRVRQFCKELIGEKMDVTWSCNARANLDYQTMRLMKRAGCRLLDVGYESADDRILSNVKKGITVNQMKEFTNNARKAGLMILADFVIGLPGETKETIEKSMRFVMELRPELMQFSIACPIPGTEFYDWVRENGFLLTDNLGDLLDARGLQRAVISYPQLTNEDMERYAEVALKKYYLSISYIPVAAKCILRKRGLSELRRMSRSATRFITYLCGRSI